MARPAIGALTFPAGVAVGVGVGGAVSGALEPRLQAIKNEAWSRFESMPLQAIEAAQLIASGERDMAWGLEEAANVGVNEERFRALVDMIDTSIDTALLFEAWRRGIINEGRFREGAKRHGIEDGWIDVLVQLRQRPLSAAESAAAWQQGYLDEGSAQQEAQLSGVNAERSQIQRELAGLPPGPETALAMLRRSIINEAEFEQMIREGNTKTKYTDEYLALEQRILSATDAAGLRLRGWITEAEAAEIGRQNGFDAEAMERLYLNRGRPATTRQVHIGWQRGGRLPGAANERDAFERSVRQSNIRTEYSDLLWAQRHTYPSAFVIRALAQDGTFNRETTERILIESGWVPEYAELAAANWAGETEEGPKSKWADRARSRLFTAAHNDYLDGNADEQDARAMLADVGASPGEIDTVIRLWNVERGRTRRDLTQAQVLKLYKKAIWTREQAQAALEDMGMELDDAIALLDAV